MDSETSVEKPFVPYQSIEDVGRKAEISRFKRKYPGYLENTDGFVVQEKIDGTNISFHFLPKQSIQVASRNKFIDTNNDGFFGIDAVLPNYKNELDVIQQYVNAQDIDLVLFGEMCGPKINGRINYHNEPHIYIFDIKMNGRYLGYTNFEWIMHINGLQHWCVPVLMAHVEFEKALEFESEIYSRVATEDALCEGVVIKPMSVPDQYPDQYFCLKKVNASFKEISGVPKPKRIQAGDIPQVSFELQPIFRQYINENRAISLISKEGPPQNKRKIGAYVKLLIEDARKDFVKDHATEWAQLNTSQQKSFLRIMAPEAYVCLSNVI